MSLFSDSGVSISGLGAATNVTMSSNSYPISGNGLHVLSFSASAAMMAPSTPTVGGQSPIITHYQQWFINNIAYNAYTWVFAFISIDGTVYFPGNVKIVASSIACKNTGQSKYLKFMPFV